MREQEALKLMHRHWVKQPVKTLRFWLGVHVQDSLNGKESINCYPGETVGVVGVSMPAFLTALAQHIERRAR